MPGGHFCRLTSENAVLAKFGLSHRPGPEGLACEGPSYSRKVLSYSYVRRTTKVLSVHKKPHKTRAQARGKPAVPRRGMRGVRLNNELIVLARRAAAHTPNE